MPKCQCAGNACSCSIVAGDGLLITGTGNASAPYQISLNAALITVTVAAPGPIDLSNIGSGAVVRLDMSANVTDLTLPSTQGARIDIVANHVVGAVAITWPAAVKWAAATPPTQTSTINRYDWFTLRSVGTDWIGSLTAGNAG
jgi:hypothetical protein